MSSLRITEDGLVSNVAAGENQGRRLTHAAVARYLQKVDRVKNGSLSASISATHPDRSGVVAGEVACRRSPPVARRRQDRGRVVRTGAAER